MHKNNFPDDRPWYFIPFQPASKWKFRRSDLIVIWSVVFLVLGVFVVAFVPQTGHAFLVKDSSASFALKEPAAATDNQRQIERGRYLVEEVAKCPECHTPRNAQGELKREAWLQGAPIWISPVRPIPNWADRAPALAGLPSFTEIEVERVLEKGMGPQGETLRPPMHIYHMNHEDAQAIVAYLKSLPEAIH